MASGELATTNAEQEKMVAYYKQALDFDKRDKDGLKPMVPFVQQIQNMSTVAAFQQVAYNFLMANYSMPFSLTVDADAKNSQQKRLYLKQAQGILASPEMYKKNNPTLKAFRTSVAKLLKQYGMDEQQSKELIENALAFDKLITEKSQS